MHGMDVRFRRGKNQCRFLYAVEILKQDLHPSAGLQVVH